MSRPSSVGSTPSMICGATGPVSAIVAARFSPSASTRAPTHGGTYDRVAGISVQRLWRALRGRRTSTGRRTWRPSLVGDLGDRAGERFLAGFGGDRARSGHGCTLAPKRTASSAKGRMYSRICHVEDRCQPTQSVPRDSESRRDRAAAWPLAAPASPICSDLALVGIAVVAADPVVVGDRAAGREDRVAGGGLRGAPLRDRFLAVARRQTVKYSDAPDRYTCEMWQRISGGEPWAARDSRSAPDTARIERRAATTRTSPSRASRRSRRHRAGRRAGTDRETCPAPSLRRRRAPAQRRPPPAPRSPARGAQRRRARAPS